MAYNYTITLYPYGNNPDAGIVKIAPESNYGYWEFKDGSEGGSLQFDNNELVDFDGHYLLPKSIVNALRDYGFILDDTFD
jgi:hypothetical protein